MLSGTGGTLVVSLAPRGSGDPNALHAPVDYELDLAARTQKNLKTGDVRPIARRTAPPGVLEGKKSPGRPRAQSMNAKPAKKSPPSLSRVPERSASSAVGSPVSPVQSAIALVKGLGSRMRSNSDVGAMTGSRPPVSPSKGTRSPPLSPRPGSADLASSSNV